MDPQEAKVLEAAANKFVQLFLEVADRKGWQPDRNRILVGTLRNKVLEVYYAQAITEFPTIMQLTFRWGKPGSDKLGLLETMFDATSKTVLSHQDAGQNKVYLRTALAVEEDLLIHLALVKNIFVAHTDVLAYIESKDSPLSPLR